MTSNYLDAENGVVGSILIDPRCLRAVEAILDPEDFGSAANRAIYEAARTLTLTGKAVDPVFIREQTVKDGNAVPAEYLVQLMDATPTAANVEGYARLTREHAQRRGVVALAEEIKNRAGDGDEPQEMLAALMDGATRLQQSGAGKALLGPMDLTLRWVDHRDRVDGGTSAAFVPTGYRDLDYILGGGLISSGMHVLAARPGMGKTTLAINIADRVAKNVGPVLFVSLEMDDEQIQAKRISRECGIPAHKLLMGRLSEEENCKMMEAAEKVTMLPVYINQKASATLGDIAALARMVPEVKLVVIDYLGKISPGNKNSRASRYEYTTEISGEIKVMARTLKVPVLVLCQINREAEKRADKRPGLADLRDSGAVEQDADTVTFLHRPDYYGNEAKRDSTMPYDTEVIVAKNRHGGTGECQMAMYAAASKFVTSKSDPRSGYRKALQTGAAE